MVALTSTTRLIFRTGPRSGENHDLGKWLRLGRGESNDIVLEDTTLSRLHCSIYSKGATVYVEDMDSTNGTRVNGETVLIRRQLRHGDVIAIGSTEIQFRENE